MSPMDAHTSKIAQIPSQTPLPPGNKEPGHRFRRYREGNLVQLAMFCRCGALPPLTAGLCHSCYWKWRHSLRFFGGVRDDVLERDGQRCRACGSDRWVGVHHRQPGSNTPSCPENLSSDGAWFERDFVTEASSVLRNSGSSALVSADRRSRRPGPSSRFRL